MTPTILQMEAVECGAAALAMVFAYYRHYLPLEKMREHCNVTRDGTKAINMVKTARQYGMLSKGLKVEMEYLEEVPLPAILFWNFNHFVVFEGRPSCHRRTGSSANRRFPTTKSPRRPWCHRRCPRSCSRWAR